MTSALRHVRPVTRASLTVLVAGVLALPALASAAPATDRASADHRVVHRDPGGDVLAFDGETEETSPAPDERGTDVRRTVVDHRADRVVVQTQVAELRRDGYRLALAEILTDSGRRYWLTVDYSREPIDRRVTLERSPAGRVACEGLSWDVDPDSAVVTGSVPRSCLKGPRWVRVGLGIVSTPPTLESSWVDDSRRTGEVDQNHLKLGPRQPRA